MSISRDDFPNLHTSSFEYTSKKTSIYNCFAYIAGYTDCWWLPDPLGLYYWPPSAPREQTVDAYIKAYESLEYILCDSHHYEEGYDKIAFYLNNKNIPIHAAIQLPSGRWSSKVGKEEDIAHELYALEIEDRSKVKIYMKREKKTELTSYKF